MDFRTTSLDTLVESVKHREVTSRELTEAALARIEATNHEINAFVALDPERALREADEVDRRIQAGEDLGPLAGVPIGVKDTEDAVGYRSTQGSLLFADIPEATADSVMVARLKAAGCVVVGKTNTPELAYKGDTDNVIFGRTRNPWSVDRSAGGSSGGSAAAVAAGMVPLATGSDGGGSLRIPAALCGLSTMKCSLGRIPVGGPEAPGWADLSSKGVMTRTIRDTIRGLSAVVGFEPTDMRSLDTAAGYWPGDRDPGALPAKILWSENLGYARVDSEVRDITRAAVDAIAASGVEVIEVESVFEEDPVFSWLAMSMIANLRVIQAVDPEGERRGDLDPGLLAMVEFAEKNFTASDMVAAADSAHRLNYRLVGLLEEAPLLLSPVTAGRTPIGDAFGTVNGVEEANWVALTYPFNMTRSPAGTVCAGFDSDSMPVGLQVVGRPHDDASVLRAMVAIEDLLAVDTVCPY